MRRVTSLQIEGLFGYASHTVHFRADEPTILTAPNGAGKTHVLSLLRAALALDVRTLLATSYATLRVDLDSGDALEVARVVDPKGQVAVSIKAKRGRRSMGRTLELNDEIVESLDPELPSYVRHIGPDRWVDTRNGRPYSRANLRQRFRNRFGFEDSWLSGHSEIQAICQEPFPVFIDTKRLDVVSGDSTPVSDFSTLNQMARNVNTAASRIHQYTEQLRYEVSEARRSSIQATQSADLSFAARALAAAKMTVNEADLHRRYDQTVERYETLAKNSLAVGEAPISFPEETTPTVRRILSVFLDDWDKRLEPLLPLNAKIQTLREVLDSKLAPSGKRTVMSARGGLEFRTFEGRRISVTSLSSGEQHLVALFTMLLFSAQSGSIVLIDEPEISLHAAWKHAFLSDITRVAAVSSLQIAMATHSSAIINGRWDLTEELSLDQPESTQQTFEVASQSDDELDDLDE